MQVSAVVSQVSVSIEVRSTVSATDSQSSEATAQSAPRAGGHRDTFHPSRGVRALFDRLDTNGDGGIDAGELGAAIDAIAASNPSISLPTAEEALAALDRNGDGSIGLKELKRALHAHRHARREGLEHRAQPAAGEDAGAPERALDSSKPVTTSLQGVTIQVTASVTVASVAIQRYSTASQAS
jgi:Ca2+-binding EF-hand superfamily protein